LNFQTHLALENLTAFIDSYLPTFRHNLSVSIFKVQVQWDR